MAASSSVGSLERGLCAMVLEALQDPIELEDCEQPVSLNPCAHIFDEESVKGLSACPKCRKPITSYARNEQVRRIIETALNYRSDGPPGLTPPALELCNRGRRLFAEGAYPESVEAFLAAQEIDLFSPELKTRLELAMLFAPSRQEDERKPVEESTEEYLGVLFNLVEHPLLLKKPEIIGIIEQQIEQVIHVETSTLPPSIRENAQWFRRLIRAKNKLSRAAIGRLREIYGLQKKTPGSTSVSNSPAKAAAGPAYPESSGASLLERAQKLKMEILAKRAREKELSKETKMRTSTSGKGAAAAAASSNAQASASAGPANSTLSDGNESSSEEEGLVLKRRGHTHTVRLVRPFMVSGPGSGYFDYSKIPFEALSPVELTCYQGDLRGLREMVDAGAQVEESGFRGMSLLHWAAAGGHEKIIDYLISRGAWVNKTGYFDPFAPIHLASLFDRSGAIRALGRHGAAVNFEVKYFGELGDDSIHFSPSPLHMAAGEGHLESATLLISLGADPNALDRYHHTPLHYAAEGGHASIIPLLVEAGADMNRITVGALRGWTPVLYAAVEGHLEAVRVLKDLGANIFLAALMNPAATTPAMAAVERGDLEMVRVLYSPGRSNCFQIHTTVLTSKHTLMHLAAKKGRVAVLEYLLQLGESADPVDESGFTPLFYAFRKGCIEVVLELIRRGANPNIRNDEGNSPPRFASSLTGHDREIYRALWESRADRNIRKDFGKLPAQCAFMTPWGEDSSSDDELRSDEGEEIDIELMLELVGLGASEEARGQEENTPLHYAACCQRLGPEMMRARLAIRPEELNAQNRNGETPLHRAISGRLIENVKSLLYFGADHSTPDREGRTPLHYAVGAGDVEILRELILAGADVRALDGEGNAPIHEAARSSKNRQEILIELRRAGSEMNAPNRAGNTPLTLSFRNTENLIELINLGADVGGVDGEGNTVIHLLTQLHELGRFAGVLDISSQMNVQNSKGETPLHFAAASQDGYSRNAAFLMDLGAAHLPNHLGQTPFYYAVQRGELGLDRVCEFIRRGGDINSRDAEGNTPLFYAREIMILYLERLGADVWVRNNQGDTPLHFMIRNNSYHIFYWFLTRHGGEIDAQNNEGDTALHLAVRRGAESGVRGSYDNAKRLIEEGADRWKPNRQGQTPLDCATDLEKRSRLERLEVRVESPTTDAELEAQGLVRRSKAISEKVERDLAQLGMLPRSNG